MTAVGQGISRVDGRAKVTGAATYAAEVEVANVAHAVIVGATVATGTIARLDIEAAQRAPGVLAVLTHANAPKLPAWNERASTDKVVQLLQSDAVQYQDQPIAVVVADSLERAQHAASLVVATYAAGAAPVLALAAGMADAYAPEKPSRGTTDSARGDVTAGLAAAAKRIEATYTTPVETHNPMELHATIAVWQGDDRLAVYDSTQGIFNVRNRLAAVFQLPKANVRVINHFVGGGFGSKGSPWSHVMLAALAARVAGRPVKLMVTRPQMFSLVGHRPVTQQRIALGATADGRLTAIRHDVVAHTSRFDEFVEPAALLTRMLYTCKNVATSHRLVRLDVSTPTFTRAPGEASGTFALESAMDELAESLGMDPLALRIRNHALTDEDLAKPYSSKSLLECYQRGAARFGWAKRAKGVRATRIGHELVGWGMASCSYPARQLPASALVRVHRDGTILVQAGTQDIGTGTYTVMTQIAADALGVPFDRVRFELGDTAYPETPLSAGSFTAASTGSAVRMAGLAMVRHLAAKAILDAKSPLFGVPLDAITAAGGALVAGGKRDLFVDVVARSGGATLEVTHQTKPSPDRDKYSMHSFGAAFAEVHVDEDLGTVRVTRFVGAYAGGRILNAKTARSQFLGGIVWGIGMALHEHTERDPRTGRVVTRDLADYHVPVSADVPDLDVIMVEEDDPHVNEVGAKGIGEIGTTGAAAAIANAVHHATGKRVRDLPITLDRLLDVVRA